MKILKISRQGISENHINKANIPVKKVAKEMSRHISKEQIQMPNRHMRKCSSFLTTRENT